MRVLLLSTSWFDFYTVELAKALSQRHEVFVVVDQYDKVLAEQTVGSSVRIIPVGWYATRRYPLRNLNSVARLARLVRRIKPDIVHVQEHDPRYLFSYPFLRQYPTVFDNHNVIQLSGMENSILDGFKDWLMPRVEGVLVHGEAMRAALVERYDIAAEKVSVLPFGKFSVYGESMQSPSNDKPPNILFFGRIEPYKGLKYLVQAEPLIAEKIGTSFTITIAGAGDLSTIQPNPADNPRYRIVNQRIESPKPFFEAADVIVMPYEEASTSGVTPVAYAYSKPVVVTDVGSLAETVDSGHTGLVVPPRDAPALAEALAGLLSDPARMSEMGRNGRRKIDTGLDWENNIHCVEECYEKAIVMATPHS